MEHHLDEIREPLKQRPTLLTVLCILTFIGSSWSIIQGIFTFRTAGELSGFSTVTVEKEPASTDSTLATLNIDTLQRDSVPQAVSGENTVTTHPSATSIEKRVEVSMTRFLDRKKLKQNAIGTIIASLFTLAGAIFMWRLRRYGFYIYVAGVIIGIIVPLYIFGNNLLVVGMSAFSGFFGLLFIILYALNLNSMRQETRGV